MKIALDAMGGDQAPKEIVAGGIQAEIDFPEIELLYVGVEPQIKECYQQLAPGRPLPQILHTSQTIGMTDSPLSALKEKRDNSISRSLELHKEGEVAAFVSAGNTGACVAAATLRLRMLEGVQRPGIACTFPSYEGSCLVLDCGANVNARPRHLLEYAVLGRAFKNLVQGQQRARVGLLNIGEEDVKGNDFVKEAFDLLSEHKDKIDFIGNAEARDIFDGSVDVVVCEGFVGNSLLKGSEGLAKFIFKSLKDVITQSPLTQLGGMFLKSGLMELKKRGDPNEFGGAPLLGVNGNVVICHGSSSSWGIRNAIRTAHDMIERKLNVNICQLL